MKTRQRMELEYISLSSSLSTINRFLSVFVYIFLFDSTERSLLSGKKLYTYPHNYLLP